MIQKIIPPLQSALAGRSMRIIKEEFLSSLKSYPLFTGITYECQIQDNLNLNHARIDTFLCLNLFGLFLFPSSLRDKPVRSIFYEEIIYVIGSNFELSLSYFEKEKIFNTSGKLPEKNHNLIMTEKNKDYNLMSSNINEGSISEVKLNVFLKNNRGKELNEDIISYAVLRTREKEKLLYSLAFLPEFHGKFLGKNMIKKKRRKEEEGEEEEEDDLIEEKQKFLLIDREINSNEMVFLIEKCFPFNFDSPFFEGSQSAPARIPRKPKIIMSNKNERGVEIKNESQDIIEKLRKPDDLKQDSLEKTNGKIESKKNKIKHVLLKRESFTLFSSFLSHVLSPPLFLFFPSPLFLFFPSSSSSPLPLLPLFFLMRNYKTKSILLPYNFFYYFGMVFL